MRNMENIKFIKGYKRLSMTPYHMDEDVKVMIGLYPEQHDLGICEFEFCVEWVMLKTNKIPRIKMFGESWGALMHKEFKGFMKSLSDKKNGCLSEPDFCKLLDSLGFKDLTQYYKPEMVEDILCYRVDGQFDVPIGITIKWDNKNLTITYGDGNCTGCSLFHNDCSLLRCDGHTRKDGKNVIFVEIE